MTITRYPAAGATTGFGAGIDFDPAGGVSGQVITAVAEGYALRNADRGPAGILNFYASRVVSPVASISVFGPGGPSPVDGTHIAYDSASVRRVGCLPVLYQQFGTDYYQNQVNGPGTPSTWAVEFLFDQAEFAVWFRPAAPSVDMWVWVDGKPTSRGPTVLTDNLSPGSLSYAQVSFPDARLRTVRVYLQIMDFGGIDVPTGSLLQVPSAGAPLGVAVLGDSWVEGAAGDDSSTPWPAVMTAGMGWDYYSCGQGGTGYLTAGIFYPYTNSERLDAIGDASPDLVVVTGGVNDRGESASDVETAATEVLSGLSSRLPTTPVVVVGPPPLQEPPEATLVAVRDGVKAAALAAGNVIEFVDPLAERWFYGTGKLGSPTGDGITDIAIRADGVHATQVGEILFAQRVTERVVAACIREGITY